MLTSNTSSPYRFKPRRHDVGAPLMRKFRRNGVAVSGDAGKLRLRMVDALHALMLTMICFTAAIVMDDRTENRLSELLSHPQSHADLIAPKSPESRIAPPQPDTAVSTSTVVRLSSIEDEPEASNPSRRAPQPRVAGEEKPAATSAAEQPLRAAASSLGQTVHR